MSIQTTSCQNCGNVFPGRNTLVPTSSQFSNLRFQSPLTISQGSFSNNLFHQDNARILHSDQEKTKLQTKGKALGAIHIMIGLVHFGLGIILVLTIIPHEGVQAFRSLATIAGYPFWGGLCFLITGVLTILGAKEGYSCLVKSSLGMSIVSAVFTSIGLILLLIDELVNEHPQPNHWAMISGKGSSAMMIVFTLLELSISSATAHVIMNTISRKM